MQIGNSISSNQIDTLANFYGFSSNTKKTSILEQYGIRLDPLTLNKYKTTPAITYLISQFVDKQTQRAVKSIEFGPKTSKVPGANIFIYEGDMIIDSQTIPTSQPSTIIIKNGNLILSGSLSTTNLYIVPD
jgi:hypothetical protein